MRVSYQLVSGKLAITVFETPFCLYAEFVDLAGNLWMSSKYTAVNLSGWKLIDAAARTWITSMNERIAAIWASVLRQPSVEIRSEQIVVTIATNVDIYLSKKKKKPTLCVIAEEVPLVTECGCDEDKKYLIANCTSDEHVRCSSDISAIELLRAENARLRDEIAILRNLTMKTPKQSDSSGDLRGG